MKTNDMLKKKIKKEMTSYIKDSFPEDRPRPISKHRPPKYSDEELIEIAIEAKSRFMGRINGNILGELTPLNYNIWNRKPKVKNAIKLLNDNIVNGSMFTLDEADTLYHVNIDMLVDRYQNNISKLKETLFFIEESRIQLYEDLKKLKIEVKNTKTDNPTIKKLKDQLKASRLESDTYRRMYENLTIVTSIPGLKELNKATTSSLKLNNKDNVADIVNLNYYFPSDSGAQPMPTDSIDIGSFFEKNRKHNK